MFYATGRPVHRGRGAKTLSPNPELWSGPAVPVARLFVGMNVGHDPVWKLRDVIDVVAVERSDQTGDPSSSFIAQRGIYRHDDGGIVEEDSAQVVIYNLADDVDEREFEEQMVDLASKLASTLQQELVIVEVQSAGGSSVKTIGVGP